MTTKTAERDKKIVEVLQNVMKLYRHAMEMDYEDQQRFILQYYQSLSNKYELSCIKEVCETLLRQYPQGLPHDSSLVKEAMKMVQPTYREIFPQDCFEEDMIIYKMFDTLIKDLFDTLPWNEMKKVEKVMVENLWRSVHNTLVDNPNFKGENPYYKRNYHEMERDKKLWLELLDKDFNTCIEYFQEEK